MTRNALSKVMRVGRATTFLVGLAVVLALVFGAATTAMGANGNNLLLGVLNNAATKTTGLVGNVDGAAALRVTNPNAGANDTALDLRVQAGEAPMRVNSAKKVANLNADRIDDREASSFANAVHEHAGEDITSGMISSDRIADGPASNLDADTLDGKDATQFAQASGFQAHEVVDVFGPLPREGTFTSNGGTLLISVAGSGFRSSTNTTSDAGRIGMRVLIDGQWREGIETYTNDADSHKAFVPNNFVVTNLATGTHKIRLESGWQDGICGTEGEGPIHPCTSTDSSDSFNVSILEIPN